jgi:membrane-bound metal-dependent hydrolase YbcI (DUF457 family)
VFIGHLAAGLAAKRVAPRVSLATLFAASQLPDLVWPVLVAAGVERVAIVPGHTAFTPLEFQSYPWSHSLLLVAVWGAAMGAVHYTRARDRAAALVLGLLAVSHWALDFISHAPDLPLYPGGARYGLGLWYSVPATLVVEGALFAAGLAMYTAATRPAGSRGRFAFVSLVAVVLVAYVGNVFSIPPSVTAVWVGGIAGGVVLLAWAAWADRLRVLLR